MKKKTLTLALCAAMMLAVTACGGKKEEGSSAASASSSSAVTSEASNAGEEESAAPESSAAQESSSANDSASSETGASSSGVSIGAYASVEEFAASDDIQSQIAGMKETLNEAGMDIEVTGEGDKLIYTYTYQELTDEDGAIAESIKTQMDAQASTFTTVANTIKAAVDVENPVVVVRYLDANGEEIFSGEYPAE